MSKVRSPLRYPGGKSRAIGQIMRHVPATTQEYREPFVGGGSVFLAMKRLFGRRIRQYCINDLNHDLYCFWKYARDRNSELAAAVQTFKDGYDDGRQLWHSLNRPGGASSELERAARFFILNRITFSGLVDSGGYSQNAFEYRFTQSSIERLARLERMLQGIEICHGDYEAWLYRGGSHVFIFLDPPYYRAASSRLYGAGGELHTSFDHERFAENMRRCPHKWLITYDDSPFIRDLFGFAHISEWSLQYGMNNYRQAKAKRGRELFIKNY